MAMQHNPQRNLWRALYVLLAVLLLLSPCLAEAAKKKKAQKPVAPRYAAIVVDHETGGVLYAANVDMTIYPASLTKMMTLYQVFEAVDSGKLKLDSRWKVSKKAAGQAPSKLGLRAGQSITVRDAILGLITKSANDAAMVVAEGLAGSEAKFVARMNETARSLGMKRTVFKNPSGLPNRAQVSSARDLATLSRALIDHHPTMYKYFATRSFNYRGVTHGNHNGLLKTYAGMDGIKTGYIRDSGFNLAASAVKNNRRVIVVAIGGRSAVARNEWVSKLLDYGFTRIASAPSPQRRSTIATRAPATEQPQSAHAIAATTPTPAKQAVTLPASTAAVAEGSWGIQVGAFRNRQAAQQSAETIAKNYPDDLYFTRIQITEHRLGETPLFRAALVGLSEADARRVCQTLQHKKSPCVVMAPPDPLHTASSLSW